MRMTRRWRMAVASVAVAGGLTMGTQSQTLSVTNGLLVRLESTAGVETTGEQLYVMTWTNQSPAGAAMNFTPTAPTSPWRSEYVDTTTPNGKPAVRFKTSSNTRLAAAANPDWDSTSMTWFLLLKPTMLTTYQFLYVMTTESTHATRRTVFDSGPRTYFGGTRDADKRYESSIVTNTLGRLAQEWMIMSTVHDGAAETVQFWITDVSNTLYTANAVANAGVWTGHSQTYIGAHTGSDADHGFDLAALLVYTNALSSSDRRAVETYLYDTYIRLPPKATVVMIR